MQLASFQDEWKGDQKLSYYVVLLIFQWIRIRYYINNLMLYKSHVWILPGQSNEFVMLKWYFP